MRSFIASFTSPAGVLPIEVIEELLSYWEQYRPILSEWYRTAVDSPYGAVVGGGSALLLLMLLVALRRRSRRKSAGRSLGQSRLVPWGGLARQGSTVIGIDFGTESIKLVQVRPTRKGPRVENFAEIPTPTGAVAEGAVADPMAITGVLANIWSALRLRQPRVGTVIGGSGVLIRHVNYPRMSKAELSRALSFDIDQHLPIPRDQAVFDYAVAEAASVSQPGQMPVMIVGAQRRLVEGQLLALKKARLRAQTIDLDALAILRGLRFSGLIPFGSQEPLVVLDLGATATRVNIFVNGVPVLTRAVPLDNRALTQVIVDGLGVDRQEAERLKREQGLVSGSRVAELLRSPLEEMLSAVSRSVEFFMIQNRGLSLSQVYLTGGGAQLPGLAPMALEYLAGTLSERFPNIGALDVRVASLPGKLAAHRRLLGVIQHLGPQFLSALGAALREEVEK